MSLFQYPQNLGDGDSQPASIQFQWYTRSKITESNPGDAVVLYMPQQASQPSTVSWDAEAFGLLGRTAYDKIKGITGPDMTDMAETVGAVVAAHAANSVASKLASKLGMDRGGGPSVTDIAGAAVGQLQNPYLTMVFKGVNFRQFSFQFKFAPFSQSDAAMIFNIVQSFRKNSLPNADSTTSGSQSAFLGYPSECEIQYLWQGQPNPWLNRFKRSVCTKVDVDYTGQGMFAATRDGFPASIILSVDFTELDIVLGGDIQYAQNGAPPTNQNQSY